MAEKVRIYQDDFPELDVDSLEFQDVFDLAEIQEIQDTFAAATGVASIITDVNGVPFTKPSNFCRMCQLVHSTELGLANCYQSDAEIGKPHPEGPILQPCLSGGLWDGGVSIYLEDRHIANWLIGQILEDDADVEKVIQYGEKIGADPQEFREAIGEVTRMPYAQFEQVGHALFVLASQLSKMALQNARQKQELALREQLQTELQESEKLQRRILETMLTGILISQPKPDGKVLYANQELANMLGATVDEVMGKPVPDLYYDPTDRPKVLKKLKEQGRLQNYTLRAKRANGEMFWVSLSLQPIRYGNEPALLSAIIDITERQANIVERERFALRLNIAAEIATQMTKILTVDELLQTVVTLIKERFDLYHVHFYMLDPDTETLTLRTGYGEPGRAMLESGHSIPLAREQSLVATSARTKVPVLVNDVTATPNFMKNPLLPDTKSEVAVPAIAGGQVLGVFDVQHDVVDYFTEADLDVFTTLAGQIAVALQNAQFIERVELNLFEADIRLKVNAALAEAQTPEQVLDAIIKAGGLYPHVHASLYIFDPDAEELTAVVDRFDEFDSGIVQQLPVGMRLTVAQMPLIAALSPDTTLTIPNIAEADGFDPNAAAIFSKSGAVSAAIVSLAARGTWLGEIILSSKQAGFFDERKQFFYELLATQGTEALYEAQLREQLQRTQASVDGAQDAIFWFDVETAAIVDINASAVTLLGYPQEEILGKSIFDFDTNYDPASQAQFLTSLSSGALRFESTYKTKHGLVPVEVMANLLEHTGQRVIYAFVRDITERKHAERALQESQQRLETVVSNMPVVLFALDAEGIFTLSEGLGLKSLGMEPGQVVGLSAFEFYKDAPDILADIQRALTGDSFSTSVSVDSVTFASWYTPIMNDAGEFVGTIGLAMDVTERQAAERAILESQQRLSALVEQSPMAVIEWDLNFEVAAWNSAAEQIFGYTVEEAMGQHAAGLMIPEEFRDYVDQVWRDLLDQKGGEHSINDNFTKDGRMIVCEWFNTPLTDAEGNTLGVASLVMDITERQRAEQIVQQSQQRLAALVEQSPLAVIEWDLNFEVAAWNTAAEQIFGYTAEEALGRHAAGLMIPEEFRAHVDQVWQGLLVGTGGEHSINDNFTKHGRTITCEWFNTPLTDVEGQTIGVASMVMDITARRQLEQERARQSVIINSSPDFIVAATADGMASYMNAAAVEMTGYTTAESYGKISIGVFQPELPPEAMETAIKEGLWRGETTLRHKDGHFFPVSQVIGAVTNTEGEVLAFTTIARDITERVAANAELERSAQQLSVTAEIATEISAILSADTLFETLVNLTKERLSLYHVHIYDWGEDPGVLALRFGYGTTGQMMKRQGHKVVLAQSNSAVAQATRARDIVVVQDLKQVAGYVPNMLLLEARSEIAMPIIVGAQLLGVFVAISKQAHYFTAATVNVFRSLMAQVVTSLQNVLYFEQQRQAESTTRNSVEQIRAMFDAIVDGVIVSDMMGEITDTNEASISLFAYESREDFIGRNILTLIKPDDRVVASEGWVAALDVGHSGVQLVTFTRKDGETFAGELTAALLRDVDDNPIGFVNIARDVTDRRVEECDVVV